MYAKCRNLQKEHVHPDMCVYNMKEIPSWVSEICSGNEIPDRRLSGWIDCQTSEVMS